MMTMNLHLKKGPRQTKVNRIMCLESGGTQEHVFYAWKMLEWLGENAQGDYEQARNKQDLFRSTLFHKVNGQGPLGNASFQVAS